MCEIVPFPLARRCDFVRRHARQMLSMSFGKAEDHLKRQLRIQVDTMQRRTIDPVLINREIVSLEARIRSEVVRATSRTGGAA